MFQIKNFVSITASVGNYMQSVTKKVTDFRVGSVFRTLVEAPAAEMDELYQQVFTGLSEAIPVAIYQAFSFDLLPAASANGSITVTIAIQAANVIIPAGTIFTIPGALTGYASQADITILAGSTTRAPFVAAVIPGTSGNISAGQTFTAQPTITGFVSATNSAALSNGVNTETEPQRKQRFAAYIIALQHGTVAAVKYGMGLAVVKDVNGNVIEKVTNKNLVEPFLTDNTQPVGLINGYIFNGSTGASSALIAAANTITYGYYLPDGTPVPGYKAAGVKVNIYAATVTLVPVTGVVTTLSGYTHATVLTNCAVAVANYISALDLGVSAILSEIIALIMNIPGVYNAVLSAPTTDTTAAATVKLMPGTITLT